MDCGPTCLRMVSEFFDKKHPLPFLRERCYIDRAGVSIRGISEAAESIGFRTLAVKLPLYSQNGTPSLAEVPLPAIAHWNQNHFVVVYKISPKEVWIADPEKGKVKISHENFKESFYSNGQSGIALLLETTPKFYEFTTNENEKKGVSFLFQYLKPHKRLIGQLIIGLLLGTVFQLIFPFLTQSLVDIGIGNQNLSFIHLVLIGQLVLFLGQTIVRFIQSWIILHISVRINVGMITDFLVKLMSLPLGFFDSKNIGDLLQRIDDHRRIENFLTNSVLSALLSVVSLIVFGIVLAIYSLPIFLIFLISSVLYIAWIFVFLEKRKKVDYDSFQQLSDNQHSLIEMIQGMPEIKLQGSQLKRR